MINSVLKSERVNYSKDLSIKGHQGEFWFEILVFAAYSSALLSLTSVSISCTYTAEVWALTVRLAWL